MCNHHEVHSPYVLLPYPYCLLQELPEQWNNVKKVAALAKQAVAPLQASEVGIIRRKLASFDVRENAIVQ